MSYMVHGSFLMYDPSAQYDVPRHVRSRLEHVRSSRRLCAAGLKRVQALVSCMSQNVGDTRGIKRSRAQLALLAQVFC